MKVVTSAEMRTLEQRAAALGRPPDALMEAAGLRVAEAIRDTMTSLADARVLVLVGPGNNGGDGLVAARHLHDWGAAVGVYLLAARPDDDANWQQVVARHIPTAVAANDGTLSLLDEWLASATVVVDALLGTGASRPLDGALGEICLRVRRAKASRADPSGLSPSGRSLTVVAVDLPTGVSADSGAADPATIAADVTVALGYPKVGLLAFPGAGAGGRLVVADIGLPPADDVARELMTADWARSALPLRPKDAHKGTFGAVLVVAGSVNYVGSAALACEGVLRVGAGLVMLAAPRSLHAALAAKLLETTHLPLAEAAPGAIGEAALADIASWLPRFDVLLVGCGLGRHHGTWRFVRRLLGQPFPEGVLRRGLVIDADALNALAETDGWWTKLGGAAVLTPHPAEMARLLGGVDTASVQARRLDVAVEAAARWRQVVVLKGAHTVVAAPDGRCRISPWANPGLATAGSGDVLAGAIAGLLAQGVAPFEAASLGVYLHGAAADSVTNDLGDAGMVAGDLPPALPRAIKALRNGRLGSSP